MTRRLVEVPQPEAPHARADGAEPGPAVAAGDRRGPGGERATAGTSPPSTRASARWTWWARLAEYLDDLGLRGAGGSLPHRRGQRGRRARWWSSAPTSPSSSSPTEPAGRRRSARQPAVPRWSACWPRKGKILGQSQDLIVIIPFNTFLRGLRQAARRSASTSRWTTRTSCDARSRISSSASCAGSASTPPGQPDDFASTAPEQLANTYQQLTGALYGVAMGVGLITLLVGGIGIMNIMLVSRARADAGDRHSPGARARQAHHRGPVPARGVAGLRGGRGDRHRSSGSALRRWSRW